MRKPVNREKTKKISYDRRWIQWKSEGSARIPTYANSRVWLHPMCSIRQNRLQIGIIIPKSFYKVFSWCWNWYWFWMTQTFWLWSTDVSFIVRNSTPKLLIQNFKQHSNYLVMFKDTVMWAWIFYSFECCKFLCLMKFTLECEVSCDRSQHPFNRIKVPITTVYDMFSTSQTYKSRRWHFQTLVFFMCAP